MGNDKCVVVSAHEPSFSCFWDLQSEVDRMLLKLRKQDDRDGEQEGASPFGADDNDMARVSGHCTPTKVCSGIRYYDIGSDDFDDGSEAVSEFEAAFQAFNLCGEVASKPLDNVKVMTPPRAFAPPSQSSDRKYAPCVPMVPQLISLPNVPGVRWCLFAMALLTMTACSLEVHQYQPRPEVVYSWQLLALRICCNHSHAGALKLINAKTSRLLKLAQEIRDGKTSIEGIAQIA